MARALVLSASIALVACGSTRLPAPPEELYFAVEIRQHGQLVGKSKLLGETGKTVRLERRKPGARSADYQVRLLPIAKGNRGKGHDFAVAVDLQVQDASAHWDVGFDHGEAHTLSDPSDPEGLQFSLMVMKVDSAEFRTLMDLAERNAQEPPYSI